MNKPVKALGIFYKETLEYVVFDGSDAKNMADRVCGVVREVYVIPCADLEALVRAFVEKCASNGMTCAPETEDLARAFLAELNLEVAP
jgi:hypothetical protein